MTILYKLTDRNGYTRRGEYNACLWAEGVTHSGTGQGDLCGPGFVHAYTHPLLAILLNPIHARIRNPRLWEVEGEIAKNDKGLKVGCIRLTVLRELPLPHITNIQRKAFALLCALEVYREKEWCIRARAWLSGEDRVSAFPSATNATNAANANYAYAYATNATNAANAANANYAYAYAAYAAYAATYAANAAYAYANLEALALQAMEIQ